MHQRFLSSFLCFHRGPASCLGSWLVRRRNKSKQQNQFNYLDDVTFCTEKVCARLNVSSAFVFPDKTISVAKLYLKEILNIVQVFWDS